MTAKTNLTKRAAIERPFSFNPSSFQEKLKMSWLITEERVIVQPIASTDTVQNHAFGTIVKAKDSTL